MMLAETAISVDIRKKNYKFVFVGGGTAGHIVPGLAVATALLDLGYQKSDILFVGATKGMEKFLVPQAGFDLKLYDTKGLSRRVAVENFFKVLRMLLDNFKSFWQALRDLNRIKPDVIVMLGGYAGLIPALAGLVLKVKTAVVNVDSLPGLSNRIVSKFADVTTVPQAIPEVKRAVVTGTPVRADASGKKNFLLQEDTEISSRVIKKFFTGLGEIRTEFYHPLLFTVMSGSLGAYSINKVLPSLAVRLAQRQADSSKRLFIYHITGERDFDRIVALAKENLSGFGAVQEIEMPKPFLAGEKKRKVIFSFSDTKGSLGANSPVVHYCITAYEDMVPELLEASDLFLGRAGASTVAEIAAIGVPALVVPLPNAPRDHQRENIRAMEKKGAIISLDDKDMREEILFDLVSSLLDDEVKRREMASAVYDLGQRDAAFRIADLLSQMCSV
jgi:UDP-N-acetylglucosamine:LPS N-acetylglucosamine transferase